jgi:hypothetical protein
MKVSDAINFCLQYHKINSRTNMIKNYASSLAKFGTSKNDKEIESISIGEICTFRQEQLSNWLRLKKYKSDYLWASLSLVVYA